MRYFSPLFITEYRRFLGQTSYALCGNCRYSGQNGSRKSSPSKVNAKIMICNPHTHPASLFFKITKSSITCCCRSFNSRNLFSPSHLHSSKSLYFICTHFAHFSTVISTVISILKDRIVPPDPISSIERRSTLQRLNQIIQQRLVTSNLTPQMKNFKIGKTFLKCFFCSSQRINFSEHGRVTFHVDHEFEMSLTLMGDGPNIPWRVLSIDFLVEDKETGGKLVHSRTDSLSNDAFSISTEGRDLVHPLQINFIQNLIQSRLNDNSKSLMDPYTVLRELTSHDFSLQLYSIISGIFLQMPSV